jgi:surface antigen
MEENRAMNRLLLAVSVGALCATAIGAGAQTNPQPKSAEQLRYEQEVRDAEAAQRQYQVDLARHQRELERAERLQRRYERRRARYDARHPNRPAETEAAAAPPAAPPDAAPPAEPARAAVSSEQCERQNRRNRGRGRALGGLLGAVGGAAVGRGNVGRVAAAALGAPVGALIGDRIARLLDCREQQQAAAATEQAVERGVGTTTNWASETRPGVTGSSTVTAAATPMADGNPCLTVTDIVIIDGEETRAPKTMCRRPPTNRYVRV